MPGTEAAWNQRSQTGYTSSSGGGFANNIDAPPWQVNHIAAYLKRHPFPAYPSGGKHGVWNSSALSRGYPDIAAVAQNVATIMDGKELPGGGTSVAAPIVAAMLAMINEERLRANKSVIGLVTPALYKFSERYKGEARVFNDVTKGWNPGCGTPGFQAAPGWDPVTGLGTLRYRQLRDAYLALP